MSRLRVEFHPRRRGRRCESPAGSPELVGRRLFASDPHASSCLTHRAQRQHRPARTSYSVPIKPAVVPSLSLAGSLVLGEDEFVASDDADEDLSLYAINVACPWNSSPSMPTGAPPFRSPASSTVNDEGGRLSATSVDRREGYCLARL